MLQRRIMINSFPLRTVKWKHDKPKRVIKTRIQWHCVRNSICNSVIKSQLARADISVDNMLRFRNPCRTQSQAKTCKHTFEQAHTRIQISKSNCQCTRRCIPSRSAQNIPLETIRVNHHHQNNGTRTTKCRIHRWIPLRFCIGRLDAQLFKINKIKNVSCNCGESLSVGTGLARKWLRNVERNQGGRFYWNMS